MKLGTEMFHLRNILKVEPSLHCFVDWKSVYRFIAFSVMITNVFNVCAGNHTWNSLWASNGGVGDGISRSLVSSIRVGSGDQFYRCYYLL